MSVFQHSSCDGSLRAKLEAERTNRKEETPYEQSRQKTLSESVFFTGRFTRLDEGGNLEILLYLLSLFLFAGGFWFFLASSGDTQERSYIPVFTGASILLMVVKLTVDECWVIDKFEKELLFSRTILGMSFTWKVCSLSQLRNVKGIVIRQWNRVRISGASDVTYFYATGLVLPDGSFIRVTGYIGCILTAHRYGKELAALADVDFIEHSNERLGDYTSRIHIPMTPKKISWNEPSFFVSPTFWDLVLITLAIVACIASLDF